MLTSVFFVGCLSGGSGTPTFEATVTATNHAEEIRYLSLNYGKTGGMDERETCHVVGTTPPEGLEQFRDAGEWKMAPGADSSDTCTIDFPSNDNFHIGASLHDAPGSDINAKTLDSEELSVHVADLDSVRTSVTICPDGRTLLIEVQAPDGTVLDGTTDATCPPEPTTEPTGPRDATLIVENHQSQDRLVILCVTEQPECGGDDSDAGGCGAFLHPAPQSTKTQRCDEAFAGSVSMLNATWELGPYGEQSDKFRVKMGTGDICLKFDVWGDGTVDVSFCQETAGKDGFSITYPRDTDATTEAEASRSPEERVDWEQPMDVSLKVLNYREVPYQATCDFQTSESYGFPDSSTPTRQYEGPETGLTELVNISTRELARDSDYGQADFEAVVCSLFNAEDGQSLGKWTFDFRPVDVHYYGEYPQLPLAGSQNFLLVLREDWSFTVDTNWFLERNPDADISRLDYTMALSNEYWKPIEGTCEIGGLDHGALKFSETGAFNLSATKTISLPPQPALEMACDIQSNGDKLASMPERFYNVRADKLQDEEQSQYETEPDPGFWVGEGDDWYHLFRTPLTGSLTVAVTVRGPANVVAGQPDTPLSGSGSTLLINNTLDEPIEYTCGHVRAGGSVYMEPAHRDAPAGPRFSLPAKAAQMTTATFTETNRLSCKVWTDGRAHAEWESDWSPQGMFSMYVQEDTRGSEGGTIVLGLPENVPVDDADGLRIIVDVENKYSNPLRIDCDLTDVNDRGISHSFDVEIPAKGSVREVLEFAPMTLRDTECSLWDLGAGEKHRLGVSFPDRLVGDVELGLEVFDPQTVNGGVYRPYQR